MRSVNNLELAAAKAWVVLGCGKTQFYNLAGTGAFPNAYRRHGRLGLVVPLYDILAHLVAAMEDAGVEDVAATLWLRLDEAARSGVRVPDDSVWEFLEQRQRAA